MRRSMKVRMIEEYDAQDLKELEGMTINDIIPWLEAIKRGHLPTNYIIGIDENRTYTEGEYESTRLHKVMEKAIDILKSLPE